ncbi:hypothetical protein SAMN04487857_1403 [Pseudomonas sp. ok272]|uniref:hypothetical protein n=1 Tax=unclassified Pseudomonas TaxID=196821 RepID=UPI0008AE6E68|nr:MULTISPECIES: hypothetical protein [unclassified Pseudomonas]SEN68303.1 hypothetical protein SAMN04487857_1403 [Pseudomonas sp. ok272]SFN38602.1 hypothetical protein SAMN04487858_1244 [Pseudomonas sp. ok602]
MRWLFLLLLVLNGFYYVWHQQEAPMRAKDVTPLSLYRGSQQGLRLLSETPEAPAARDKVKLPAADEDCLYLGGFARQETAKAFEVRLVALGVGVQPLSTALADSAGYWVRVAPESRQLVNESVLQNLAKEFNELKHKIIRCEGVATAQ